MSQHIHYNAVNRFYQGNYEKTNALLERHHDPHTAWTAIKDSTRINPQTEYDLLTKRGVRLILKTDDGFPPLLREIPRAPHGIYCRGACDFSRPTVAIVGTRRATGEGIQIARRFSEQLAAQGIIIASGLALGIDGAAHAGALASGTKGATIAVLPCGLDDLYPKSHANLANEIIRTGGTLVSEYPFGTPSFPFNFLERNRIVSGLSRGTVVIEAPLQSGALVTAKLALDQNRDVFAVPGPISHPNYGGPHKLIQEGAGLVTSAEEICDALGLLYQKSTSMEGQVNNALSPEERLVHAALLKAGKPMDIDTIAKLCSMEIRAVSRATAILTVNGTLNETNGLYHL